MNKDWQEISKEEYFELLGVLGDVSVFASESDLGGWNHSSTPYMMTEWGAKDARESALRFENLGDNPKFYKRSTLPSNTPRTD